jgi:hypothetical protein
VNDSVKNSCLLRYGKIYRRKKSYYIGPRFDWTLQWRLTIFHKKIDSIEYACRFNNLDILAFNRIYVPLKIICLDTGNNDTQPTDIQATLIEQITQNMSLLLLKNILQKRTNITTIYGAPCNQY